MALFEKTLRDLGNAPKSLSSEFDGARSETKNTYYHFSANGEDPLARGMGHIPSIAAPLASLAPL